MRGYKEEGTTTIPFDMVVLNDMDRFHPAQDASPVDQLQEAAQAVKRGDLLSLNDAYVLVEVEAVRGADVAGLVRVGGELRSKKGAFTDRDRECLAFALGKGVDAMSP